MEHTDIVWAGVAELSAWLREGRLSVAQVAEAMIERIHAVNPAINALVHVDEDRIRTDAAALDAQGASGRPLFGIPYTHKELTPVAGVPHTLGFAFLKDRVATKDAIVVERMRASGGLYLGQTNSSEGGYSATTRNRLFGPTRNPWNLQLSPGGSSGGAAAAVAAGIGPIAEGTDAGGSIRVPAAFTGVVGFKPSTGTIAHTLLPQRFVSNLSHGVLGRSVADVVSMMDVVAGYDARDPLARNGLGETASPGPAGWKIAYSPDLGFADVDEEVAAICRKAVEAFVELGAEVVEETPDWERLQDAIWMGVCIPGFAGMRGVLDWPSMRGQLDDELIDLVLFGDTVSLADVAKGEALRGRVWDAFAAFMTEHRLLVSPTTTDAAFGAEDFTPPRYRDASLRDRLFGWTLTHPFNLTTSPAISVPCGFTRDGRPVGLQIAGRMNADQDVLAAAAAFEKNRPWQDSARPRVQ